MHLANRIATDQLGSKVRRSLGGEWVRRMRRTGVRASGTPDRRRAGNACAEGDFNMICQPYSQLIAIKRWADRGLYAAVGQNFDRLTNEDASIMLRILDHIHVVDRIFQHHLRGLPHTFQAPRSAKMPELQALAHSVREVDDWYASYVGSLAESDFEQPVDFVFTSGRPAHMRRGEIILHVCLHGTYHRGNAGAVLQLKGITPSRDAITDFLEDAT
jgi:uncharacterized damage-inducible protein DinB